MPSRVLVVDDSRFARMLAVRRLEDCGVEATPAGSCEEACAVDPSALAGALLDLDLGDGFGTEVARHLRAAVTTLPVAFLTATESASHCDAAQEFGPVFSKADGLDAAVAWVLDAIAREQRSSVP